MRRCERHDLALRPDGTCVLCERERPSGGGSRAPLIVALVIVAGVAAAGVIHTQRPRPQPIAALPTETAPAATTPAVETTTTPYRDLPPAETYLPPAVVTEIVPGPPQPVAAAPPKSTEPDPAALRSAARSVKVVMYTTTWCPQCKKAKAWLNENGVSYSEHDIEASESDRVACKKLNPTCSIPTLDIDGEVIVGYGPSHMRAAIDNAARRRLAK